MPNQPDQSAAPVERLTACAWCGKTITTDRPWRPDEYQVHTACLPLADEYAATIRKMFDEALGRVLTVGEGHDHAD